MMQNKTITGEWLEKAEEDFGFASSSLEFKNYFGQICFHFQQASEKYLKAFILAHQLAFRPIHNLIELLEICRQKEIEQNQIVFVNWDSLNKEGISLFMSDNEKDWNLSKVTENTRDEGKNIVLIIDESHRTAKTSKSQEIVNMIVHFDINF